MTIKTPNTSRTTREKYRDFASLFGVHSFIVKNIHSHSKYRPEPYVFIDMNCGEPKPILYDEQEYESCGVQAGRIVADTFAQYKLAYIDRNQASLEKTEDTLSYLHQPPTKMAQFVCGDYQNFDTVLAPLCQGITRYTYGMVFHDPYNAPSYATLKQLFDNPNLQRIDLVIHGGITTEKRDKGAFGDRGKLTLGAAIRQINKKHWLIRTPSGQWQWTFIIGTNWPDFPEWKKRGFYTIQSPEGQKILKQLTYTRKEIKQLSLKDQPILFEDDNPPPGAR